jgi:hypothetical protein
LLQVCRPLSRFKTRPRISMRASQSNDKQCPQPRTSMREPQCRQTTSSNRAVTRTEHDPSVSRQISMRMPRQDYAFPSPPKHPLLDELDRFRQLQSNLPQQGWAMVHSCGISSNTLSGSDPGSPRTKRQVGQADAGTRRKFGGISAKPSNDDEMR